MQIQPEGFEAVLCDIGFEPAQRLGEPGEGREYLGRQIAVAVIDESIAGFRRPVDLYVKRS